MLTVDTSFIVATSTAAVVEATLAALSRGAFTRTDDGFTTLVHTDIGDVEVVVSSTMAGLVGHYDGRPVFIGNGEHDSPFHGTRQQRTALLAHIVSLIG